MMKKEDEMPKYLTLKEFCRKLFPIGERTVWRMISIGEFPKPAARIGKKTAVWRTDDLLEWIKAQERLESTHHSVNVSLRTKKKKKMSIAS